MQKIQKVKVDYVEIGNGPKVVLLHSTATGYKQWKHLIENYKNRFCFIAINLIGGERGLISYFNKKNTYEKLIEEDEVLTAELKDLDHKISLINKNDPDYLDMLYRQKLNFVTEDEIIIKLQ